MILDKSDTSLFFSKPNEYFTVIYKKKTEVMLVVDLGKWMNKTLINWGIDPAVADRFDETIMALLMIVVAIVLNYLCQAILIGGMKQ